jgi:DNA anti-recombination protein RmuC
MLLLPWPMTAMPMRKAVKVIWVSVVTLVAILVVAVFIARIHAANQERKEVQKVGRKLDREIEGLNRRAQEYNKQLEHDHSHL